MSRFCPLFSSSSGNSVYIGDEKGGVLFDVGRSAKQTREHLSRIGVPESAVKAVFVTHEHSDHVSGLSVFAKRNDIPVFASSRTLLALKRKGILDGSHRDRVIPETGTEVAGFWIQPFCTSHDCADGRGYIITTPGTGEKAAIATDTGFLSADMLKSITGCRLVYLESNHDVTMLKNGPYPYVLQRRILSDIGHLSNDACASALCSLVNHGTTEVVLAHLSRENNTPACAYETSVGALREIGALENRDYHIRVAQPDNTAAPLIF